MQLSQNELRVIGCLIEKSITTPDIYPLSLNALTNACNQKSNREPVMSLSESEVQDTLDQLAAKHLILNQSGASSRVPKYKHRFCNTEFSDLQLTSQQLGILCVLFLRGPQTAGELRTRTNRLCQFDNVQEAEAVLNDLMQVDNGKSSHAQYVVKLPREPGRRESRYMHCFSDEDLDTPGNNQMQSEEYHHAHASDSGVADSHKGIMDKQVDQQADNLARIKNLEEQVALLQMEVDELRERLDALEA